MPGPALSPLEREEIRAFLVDDPIVGFASIAIVLGRDASTISREVGRNGGRERYRATAAPQRADHDRKRHRPNLLNADPVLACLVRADLDQGFSPAACAARLRRSGAGAICHETIYRSVFDGSLGLKPTECLRTATQAALADIVSEEYGCRYDVTLQRYGPSHPELYRRFMRSISVDPSQWETVPPIDGIEHFRSVHYALFQGGEEVETMGAVVFGMESSTPYRHERVATGRDRFAADNDIEIDHTFFSRHVEVDPRHGQSILMTLRHWLDDPDKVERLRQGAFRSFDTRKVFLDQVLDRSRC